MKSTPSIDARKARVCLPDGSITEYEDQKLAYAVWLALPKGTRAAFRGTHDPWPLYPWDYADAQ